LPQLRLRPQQRLLQLLRLLRLRLLPRRGGFQRSARHRMLRLRPMLGLECHVRRLLRLLRVLPHGQQHRLQRLPRRHEVPQLLRREGLACNLGWWLQGVAASRPGAKRRHLRRLRSEASRRDGA